jgi:hypothetical protein
MARYKNPIRGHFNYKSVQSAIPFILLYIESIKIRWQKIHRFDLACLQLEYTDRDSFEVIRLEPLIADILIRN